MITNEDYYWLLAGYVVLFTIHVFIAASYRREIDRLRVYVGQLENEKMDNWFTRA